MQHLLPGIQQLRTELGPWEQLLSFHHLGGLALCLLASGAHDFLPDSELMFAVPLPWDISVQILPGKEQYSHFPSCPAVRARKRGGSPSYCPATPSKRCIPRKTVLYLEIRSCQQTKPETSCCKTEKKILSFCSFKITRSIENTAWCPFLIPSASNLYILL